MKTETIDTPGGFIRAVGTEAEVCRDIADRQALGIRKYGTTVAENPLSLREWLTHAYQECLDQAVYLKRAIAELDAGQAATGPTDQMTAALLQREQEHRNQLVRELLEQECNGK